MTQDALDAVKAELRALVAARLNVRARNFERAVQRAGRRLPPPARAAAAEICAIDARLRNPKLAARTDPAIVAQAAETIRVTLARYRPGARAAQDRSLLMAEIGFKLAALIGLGLVFVQWQTAI